MDLVITALKKLKKLYVVYAQRRTALKKTPVWNVVYVQVHAMAMEQRNMYKYAYYK